MKIILSRKGTPLGIIVMISFVLLHMMAVSQVNHQLVNGSPSTLLFLNGKIGLGPFNLSNPSLFHITSTDISTPFFQLELKNSLNRTISSIKQFYYNQDTIWGIYQTGDQGTFNYFQNPVKIGNLTLKRGIGRVAQINTDHFVNQLHFIMNPSESSPDSLAPLTIHPYGIIVREHITGGSIQLISGAGMDKILMSDELGNGKWTDPPSFNDEDWKVQNAKVGETRILYSNPNYSLVGVGTENPLDKFQVNDLNGRVVIGTGPNNMLGDKPNSKSNSSDQKSLNKNPDSYPLYGQGYIGFNVSHNQDGWLVPGEGIYNAGSLIYNSLHGNMYFCTIPSLHGPNPQITENEMIQRYTNMTLDPQGNVGIGTIYPSANLDVRHEACTKIQSVSESQFEASFWAINNIASYGFGVDEWGIGNIWETKTGIPSRILSFHAGKVGIGAVDLNQYLTASSSLFVEGGITTEEVTVKLKNDWPDFVFEKDYKIMPIKEIENYIQANKHLPDVPSKTEMEKNGIEVGKMNALLLKKVEELTLYVIELKKEIDELKRKQ